MFSYVDHQLIKEHDDDLVFSMISSLTHRLENNMEEINSNRTGTVQMS